MNYFALLVSPPAVLGAVLLSFYGWGSVLTKTCLYDFHPGTGLRTVFGFGIFIFLSAYVDALQLANTFYFYGFLALGTAYALARIARSRPHLSLGWTWIIFWLAALGIFLCFWLVKMSWPYNYHDDFDGYLIMPIRILTEGHQGFDFMNERRIAVGGGGGSYLGALFLSFLPLEHLRIADDGIGFWLILLLVLEHSKSRLLALASAVFLAFYTPLANISTTYSGAAFAYGLFLFSYRTLLIQTTKRYLFWGLLAGALAATKTNYLFPVAIAGTIEWILLGVQSRSLKSVRLGLIAFLAGLSQLVPWMITNLRFAGTALSPILGSGYSHTGTGKFNPAFMFESYFFELLPFLVIAIVAAIFILVAKTRSHSRETLYIALLPTITTLYCLFLCTTPAGGGRYSFAASAIPALFLLNAALFFQIRWTPKVLHRPYLKKGFISLVGALLLWSAYDINRQYLHLNLYAQHFNSSLDALEEGRSNQANIFSGLDIDFHKNRMRKMQSLIPEKENLLARMDLPFLFDYSRNFVSVVDGPGCNGPDGGLPYEDINQIAEYMRTHGFRYYSYSYRYEALQPQSMCEIRLRDPWDLPRYQAVRICTFQKQMPAFIEKYKILYIDDYDVLLDLCVERNGHVLNQALCAAGL